MVWGMRKSRVYITTFFSPSERGVEGYSRILLSLIFQATRQLHTYARLRMASASISGILEVGRKNRQHAEQPEVGSSR